MTVKQILSISLIALASSAAMADGGDIGVSNYPIRRVSSVSRASVEANVLAARASGELREAGEVGDIPYAFEVATQSTLSRAQVRQATLQAAKAGELMPAGLEYFERPTGETRPAVVGSGRVSTSVGR